jgi:hypothetical protein
MKIKAPPRIMIVAALCALALIGLVVREGAARSGGFEVLLPMEAVDPRSLLSGHYVDINLTQRLADGAPCPRGGMESKWLALQPEGNVHVVAGGADSRDEAQQIGPVLVRGAFECWEMGGAEGAPAQNVVRLDIGVERFHINQTDALRIERALREQQPGETRAFAIVSIGRDGRARLRGLMLDSERLELAWL